MFDKPALGRQRARTNYDERKVEGHLMRTAVLTFAFTILCTLLAEGAPKPAINWSHLHNPVLSYPNWSIKDFAVARRDNQFYVFFSAFYRDHGKLRSHVVEVTTSDFQTFSKPIMDFDGEADGYIGMCSPDVQKLGSVWELSFNSWGDDARHLEHQLFYMTSSDLIHWSPRHPFAENLTAGEGADDLTVTRISGQYYAMWKEALIPHGLPRKVAVGRSQTYPWKYGLRPRMAEAKSLNGPWRFVDTGYPTLKMADGKENGLIHENFQFVWIDGVLHVFSSAYPHGHHAFLYTLLSPSNLLDWGAGIEFDIPTESFNKVVPYDAGAVYDWRKQDGYFYLIYAGHGDKGSYAGRGWNRMALARSKNLRHWTIPGSSK